MRYQKFYKKDNFIGVKRASVNRSDSKGWVSLITPYNTEFLEELKMQIPGSMRRWIPDKKIWEVSDLYLDKAVLIMKQFFDEIITDMFDEEPKAVENVFQPLFEILKDMPNGSMEKVYRALSMALHPDVGGSAEQMIKLNQAYDMVKK